MIAIKKWGGRCLVSLPLLNLPKQHLARNAQRRTPPQKKETAKQKPPRQTENKQTKTNHHQTSERRRRKKKKKQVREPDLVKGAEHEERVVIAEHVQDEESQGETQTPNGAWVSPAPERERERERKRKTERKTSPANIPITKEKKERTTNTKANTGAGPKGHQTKQRFDPQDQDNHTKNPTIIPKAPNKRPLTNQIES